MQKLNHKYSDVFEYQETFYEIVETAFRIQGSNEFINLISNIIDFVVQPAIIENVNKLSHKTN